MKKKWVMFLLAAAVAASGTALIAGEGLTQMDSPRQEMQEERNEYLIKQGKVTEIRKEEENYSILVGTPQDGIRFIVRNGSLIINAETLEVVKADQIQEGMQVTVILPKDAPMGLSLPPVSSAQVAIIINSDKCFVEEDFFDETLTNESNTLALNITQDTCIINTTGERRIFTAEDIKNHNAVVIYTVSTRSIPAQTTPKWVLILPTAEVAEGASENSLQQEKVMQQEETQYVSIREAAQNYGYTLKWENQTKTVTLAKGDKLLSFTAGEKQYSVGSTQKTLIHKVKLVEERVLVPIEVIENL